MENTNISFPSEYYDQKHVHELVGSTVVAGNCNECHNHRFATVSDEAMQEGKSHVHFIKDCTESEDGHKHFFQAATLIDSPIDTKRKHECDCDCDCDCC